jgi:hypothetical protein
MCTFPDATVYESRHDVSKMACAGRESSALVFVVYEFAFGYL